MATYRLKQLRIAPTPNQIRKRAAPDSPQPPNDFVSLLLAVNVNSCNIAQLAVPAQLPICRSFPTKIYGELMQSAYCTRCDMLLITSTSRASVVTSVLHAQHCSTLLNTASVFSIQVTVQSLRKTMTHKKQQTKLQLTIWMLVKHTRRPYVRAAHGDLEISSISTHSAAHGELNSAFTRRISLHMGYCKMRMRNSSQRHSLRHRSW